MELRQVRYFVVVARERHFTRAAAEIAIAQPALSQQIRALERELGVVLFDRTTRHVRLTAAGEAFLVHAERLLAEAAEARRAMQEFAGLARGRVAFGTVPTLPDRWLAGALAGFNREHPAIELVLREETTDDLVASIQGGRLDLALLHLEGDAAAGLATAELFAEDAALLVVPDHPLVARGRVRLADLRDEPWVFLKAGGGIRRQVLDACAAAGFAPRVAFESSALGPVRAMAAAGLGVAAVPRSVAHEDGPPVAVVELEGSVARRTVGLAWRPGVRLPPAPAAFAEFLRRVPPPGAGGGG